MADKYDTIRVEANDKAPDDSTGPAQSRYAALEPYRQPFLDRARECSELTLPYLIPPDGWTGTQKLRTPFQGIGSAGVLNIVSKLMLALFPPNTPFSRLRMDGRAEDAAKANDPKFVQEVEAKLAEIDRKIAAEVEMQGYRPHLNEGTKHLVVGGNVLLHFPEDHAYIEMEQSIRVFHLDRYVCKRSPSGKLLEIVVKEPVSPNSLDETTRDAIKSKVNYGGDDKTCDIYTHIKLNADKRWIVYQEVQGMRIPDSEGDYPADKLPWFALRWNKIDGEDYGRGHIEDHLGDLQTCEGLSQAVLEGSSAASKVLFFVKPNGTTRLEDVEKAANGAVVHGNAEDVTVLRVEKANDFQTAQASNETVERRLSRAFMLNSSAQRNGERVTAEEWRFMVQDIEDALGGIYSILASELQLPLVRLMLHRMTKTKKIPALPKGSVTPTIVTGLEALGRGHDLEKLRSFMKDYISILTPEVAMRFINADDLGKRLSTGGGIDPTGLIKTKEEIAEMQKQEAAAQQQAQVMDIVTKMGPAGLKLASEHAKGAPQSGEGNTEGVPAGA